MLNPLKNYLSYAKRKNNDTIKVIVLALLTLVILGYFLAKGLTLDNYQFFLSRRIPKILSIVLAALAIASSSFVFQTITNNRILTPSILGFDSLYVMIQVILVVAFGGLSSLVIDSRINFILSSGIMILSATTLFHFYFKRQNRNIFTLLLIGIVLGSLFSSVTGFFGMLINPNEFAFVQGSMFASFNNVNADIVYWCVAPLLLCFICLLRLSPQLDIMWLGEDNAKSLGVDTKKLIMKLMFIITILISISTALVGPVLFFGLVVVALSRQIFNNYQHHFLILSSSVLATLLLVSGQWFVEDILDFESTISVIINFIGGGYFLILLMQQKLD
ncbi:iron chelate uptake ABC transporter family permease subunit [Psychromonas sp. SP041]|uniref:iron chelate uptake ABC transporter family permease subunit n=1 Tax=Psychromonas sp. SP041 TaxID=1365007 RepID=UPI000415F6BA|nr:iron chelate uptake ABC transporter family permease subunit [Psychromonas sp. SP041]